VDTQVKSKTAFVLAGGGSLGAVQVGMLKALTISGIHPDFIVGSSVGAINGAYFAARPNEKGLRDLSSIWEGMTSKDIFPFSLLRGLIRLLMRRDHLLEPDGLRRLIENNLPYRLLEEATIPCHVVATDIIGGQEVVFSNGSASTALLASTAIPAIFPPIAHGNSFLVDGGIANNTPVSTAIDLGATKVIVLPTGFACALKTPPRGAVPIALQAMNLITARQLATDLERLAHMAKLVAIPPLCPMAISPYDLSHSAELIDQAKSSTLTWIETGGLEVRSIPKTLYPHGHQM
jgi:NTE family protein